MDAFGSFLRFRDLAHCAGLPSRWPSGTTIFNPQVTEHQPCARGNFTPVMIFY